MHLLQNHHVAENVRPNPGPQVKKPEYAVFAGRSEARFMALLKRADVEIGGSRPWDIQMTHPQCVRRILADGTLGVGESYMDGWWDCAALDECIARVLRARLHRKIILHRFLLDVIKAKFFNQQAITKAPESVHRHYDLGNALYESMLDRRMIYSCGYWPNARTLDEAQEQKLQLICEKLMLRPGMRLLDIGCGWGGLAEYAATQYHVEVVGITLSEPQAAWAAQRCAGLSVEIRLQDYREVHELFDRIVSVGMFEHVGCKNYAQYMQVAHRCLHDNGLLLLHTIGGNSSVTCGDPWVQRYIFPNAMLPSIAQIGAAIEQYFVMEDWQNLGTNYDRTLLAWFHNFHAQWPTLRVYYDERFYRMWKYYLLSSAAAFRARDLQVWQVLLSKNGAAMPLHRATENTTLHD